MAFYGDNPFQGDPVFNYQDSVDWKSAEAIRKAMLAGFEQAGSLGAFDVDACVWAWACAEMLALALGRPSSPRPPMPFAAATRIPDPETLVPLALQALSLVREPKTSELASLMADAPIDLGALLSDLEARLRGD